MSPTLYAQIARSFWVMVPLTFTFFLVLLSVVPFGVMGAYVFSPCFAFAAVFYWTLRRPDLFPPASVFAIGLSFDLISGGPLGLWALAFLTGYGFLLWQRVLFVGTVALPAWLGFALASFVAFSIAWFAASWQADRMVQVGPVLLQAALTIAVFPLVARLCVMVETQLPEPE